MHSPSYWSLKGIYQLFQICIFVNLVLDYIVKRHLFVFVTFYNYNNKIIRVKTEKLFCQTVEMTMPNDHNIKIVESRKKN